MSKFHHMNDIHQPSHMRLKCVVMERAVLQCEWAKKLNPPAASSLIKWEMHRFAWLVFRPPSSDWGWCAYLISLFRLVKETHLKLLLLRWPLLKYLAYLQGLKFQRHLAFLPGVFTAMMSLNSGHFLELRLVAGILFGGEHAWLGQLHHTACWVSPH